MATKTTTSGVASSRGSFEFSACGQRARGRRWWLYWAQLSCSNDYFTHINLASLAADIDCWWLTWLLSSPFRPLLLPPPPPPLSCAGSSRLTSRKPIKTMLLSAYNQSPACFTHLTLSPHSFIPSGRPPTLTLRPTSARPTGTRLNPIMDAD